MVGKNKKGIWYYRIYAYDARTGKKTKGIYKSGFKTKKEAQLGEALANNELHEKNKEKDTLLDADFEHVYSEYVEFRKRSLKASTWDNAEKTYTLNILSFFKGYRLSKINKRVYQSWRKSIERKDVTLKHKNTILSEIKRVFIFIEKNYPLNYNFIIDDIPFKDDAPVIKKQKEIYSINEVMQLINKTDDLLYKTLIATMFFTGARIGEIRALKWTDYSDKKISITKSLYTRNKKINDAQKYTVKPKTKTSNRVINIPTTLSKILDEWKEYSMQNGTFKESWYIFGDEEYISETTIRRNLIAFCNNAGVKFISPHKYRSSYTTFLINESIKKNLNPKYVQLNLGHSSIKTTYDNYVEVSLEEREKNIDELFDDFE